MSSAVIEVAFAADERYVPHAATLLHSLGCAHAPERIRAHLLHPPSLRRQTIKRLASMVGATGGSIEFHPVPPSPVRGLPASRAPAVAGQRPP